jgi:hypothetical protein
MEPVSVLTCDFETLLALADQMPPGRFESVVSERADRELFQRWLEARRQSQISAPINTPAL